MYRCTLSLTNRGLCYSFCAVFVELTLLSFSLGWGPVSIMKGEAFHRHLYAQLA